MTRILVQRGSSSGSSSNPTRPSSLSGSSSAWAQPQVNNPQVLSVVKDEEIVEEAQENVILDELPEYCESGDNKAVKSDDLLTESFNDDNVSPSDELADGEKVGKNDIANPGDLMKGLDGLRISERVTVENVDSSRDSLQNVIGSSQPPPPPVPPPKLPSANSNSRRSVSGSSNAVRIGPSRRAVAWPVVSTRTSPNGSRPSSPRSHGESEGYNSADEQSPCFVSSYDDTERERQFEIDIRRAKGFEVKKMLEDGNCLFRAVADQVYGDSEAYDLIRQMCIDYMERERDHFSQFITEGFTSYCKRKRRDKVYGNNVEIQALSEMYNRPIHIYSYTTEPINIFHGSYDTDTPPLRLSYHHGNHYNSLVDPRRQTIGVGLGFSRLRGSNVDKDQVKAAIKAQQDQQIDNALLAEGRFYSDLELTEKEIERMVMEASRLEYADGTFKQQLGRRESSTSSAEPSSSGAKNLVEDLLGDFEFEVQHPYLLYRNAAREVNGIWFYSPSECEEVANLFSRILSAYSKVPQKSMVSPTKSEFEELEAVPSMVVMDGPLEPSSSTASHVTDVPDDLAFVNFFNGYDYRDFFNYSNYQSSSTVSLPSHPVGVAPSSIPGMQIPSAPLLSSATLSSYLDLPESHNTTNLAGNLVKPSSFFVHPSSSARNMPPVSASIPAAPLLHPAVSVQRPYGAPLLQPFPPPAPPPSLTPASFPTPNYGPVNRDKVRNALMLLVQDNQFIDMVYGALQKAPHS